MAAQRPSTPEPERSGTGPPAGGSNSSLAGRALATAAELGLRGSARIARRLGLDGIVRGAVDRALAGPLAERIVVELVERGVVERVTAELIERGVPARVVDQVVASEVPEQVIDRVMTTEFTERIVDRVLESPGIEPAAVRVIESDLVDELTDRVLESEEMSAAIERVAASPEVRGMVARQGVGMLEDLGRKLGSLARRLDGAVERPARWLARRSRRPAPPPEAGVVTRLLALAVDALLLNAALFGLYLAAGLALSLVGYSDADAVNALVAGGVIYLAFGAIYLGVFWTLTGQTPGMRFMRIRVTRPDGSGLSARDSLRRLVGMALSALLLMLGFVIVLFSERRRGLLDLVGHTVVVYVPPDGGPVDAGGSGVGSPARG